jgi:hypothetical protein
MAGAIVTERQQIDAIGNSARGGKLVGFFVDDDAKADRYLAQLLARFPTITLVDRRPFRGVVLVRVRGQAS